MCFEAVPGMTQAKKFPTMAKIGPAQSPLGAAFSCRQLVKPKTPKNMRKLPASRPANRPANMFALILPCRTDLGGTNAAGERPAFPTARRVPIQNYN